MARRISEREPRLPARRATLLSGGDPFPLRTSASFLAATAETPKAPDGSGAIGSLGTGLRVDNKLGGVIITPTGDIFSITRPERGTRGRAGEPAEPRAARRSKIGTIGELPTAKSKVTVGDKDFFGFKQIDLPDGPVFLSAEGDFFLAGGLAAAVAARQRAATPPPEPRPVGRAATILAGNLGGPANVQRRVLSSGGT